MDVINPHNAPGRLDVGRPVAIVDIGSNSVRLVIYEGQGRAPTPLYNEKLLCGLAQGVATSGRLPDEAVLRTLDALARFRILCATVGVGSIRVLATAAARDAENGPAFLKEAQSAIGQDIALLTGEREAALSASGVICGFMRPDGVVGDLGGGSLELVDLSAGVPGRGVTLPLGGLVLKDLAGGSLKQAASIVRREVGRRADLRSLHGRTFYAVGGTWRALAKGQMAVRNYPLRVLHGYEFDLSQGRFIDLVERAGSGKTMSSAAEARRPLLAYGALVLDEIVAGGRPGRVVVSALGVREGLLFDELDPETRQADPLLVAAAEFNLLRSRSPRHGEELIAWTDAFVASLGEAESVEERRLRHSACLLSDIGWRAHPDYRGEQSIALIANASFLAIDHPGRAYLALAVNFRHEGLSVDKAPPVLAAIATPRLMARARLLGALLRVAYPISIGTAGALPQTPLLVVDGTVVLALPKGKGALASERLGNRLRALGKLLDRDAAIRTV